MSFFGTTGREMKWIVTIDDSKLKTGLSNTKQSFRDLDTTTTTTSKNMGSSITQQFRAIDAEFKKTRQSLQQFEAEIKKAEQQQESFGTKLKNTISKFSTFSIGISTTINSVTQLGRSYRDLEDTQIAVDRTALKMSKTQEAANKAQGKLNELTSNGIKGGAAYEQALLDVKQTTEAATLATQIHEEALESQGDTYMNFAQSLVPTVIASVSTLGAAFKDLGGRGDTIKKGFSGLGSTLGIIGTQGPIAGAGMTAFSGGVDKASFSLKGLAFTAGSIAGPLIVAIDAIQDIPNLVDVITSRLDQMDPLKAPIDRLKARKKELESVLHPEGFLGQAGEWIGELIDPKKAADAKKELDEINKKLEDLEQHPEKLKEFNNTFGGIIRDITPLGPLLATTEKGVAGVNFQIRSGAQQWFPQYIMNLKQYRDTIQSLPKGPTGFKLDSDTIAFFQWLNNPNPSATTTKNIDLVSDSILKLNDVITTTNGPMQQMMGTLKDPQAGKAFLDSWSKTGAQFPQIIQNMMDDALGKTTSGLEKITTAFNNTRKGKLDFDVKFDKAEDKFNNFLAEVGEKLDKGGSEGAKAYVEKFATKGDKEMEGASRIMFQPIFDYVEKHKGEDAASWMDGFLQLIDGMDDETRKSFTALLIHDKDWKKFGKSSGDNWTKGFTNSLDDAKREANKAAEDIAEALHMPKGSFKFDVEGKAQGGLIRSYAKGGMLFDRDSITVQSGRHAISAQAGKIFTTRGPQLVLAGDNPGGKETVAFIPHTNPGRDATLKSIESVFGDFGDENVHVIRAMHGEQNIQIHNHSCNCGNTKTPIIFEPHIHMMDREIVRSFKKEVGTGLSKFGL